MVRVRNYGGHAETYLVMMRGADKDDWAITRDIESTAWAYLSEEYLDDYPPEHQSGFICDCRHVEDGASCKELWS